MMMMVVMMMVVVIAMVKVMTMVVVMALRSSWRRHGAPFPFSTQRFLIAGGLGQMLVGTLGGRAERRMSEGVEEAAGSWRRKGGIRAGAVPA